MRDFIGQEITVGCFVAAGGTGNRDAEYGMILYRVEDVAKDTFTATRIKVSYAPKIRAVSRKSTLRNANKFVVVQPPQPVVDLFHRILAGTHSQSDAENAGRWVHGTKPVKWEKM